MAHLFSPLIIAGCALASRIVAAPGTSGLLQDDGFLSDELTEHWLGFARGGAGLILGEMLRVSPPAVADTPHLGLYADAFVPRIARLAALVHATGAKLMLGLDEPGLSADLPLAELYEVGEDFIRAAWRVHAAGADGVLLTAADGGVLHRLISPRSNPRNDSYGSNAAGRIRLASEIIEGMRAWLGRRLLIGFRLPAEELAPDGMTLQDARVAAKRVTASGVTLLDVTVVLDERTMVAQFPGWSVPLANAIKRVVTEVPVVCASQLDDPLLADSVVRDGSIDLVMVERGDPGWSHAARAALQLEFGTDARARGRGYT